MDTSIIAVGTELLFGQVVNTNAAYISDRLNHLGFNVMYHFVVGDNPGRLREMLDLALSKTDLVILTGGLGPTQDDLTKKIVADAMGSELYLNEECLADIRSYFEDRGRKMADNNIRQAYIPVGADVFRNERGTAPAFALMKDGKCAICLPGPPREMSWVFDNCVVPYIRRFMSRQMYYRIIRTIGIGESDLETELMPLIDGQTDPTIATYAKEGECTLRVASQRDTIEEAREAVENMIDKISGIVGDWIYSTDNEELNEVVVKKLREKGLKLTSAESCTGGCFAASITDVPGASNVFEYGFVTYSEGAKESVIGVDPDIIKKYTVVSSETALAMAEGAFSKSGADIAVSITGFAGPDADEGREPGTAFIGYCFRGRKGTLEVRTGRDDRAWNRNYFRLMMLKTVNELLDGIR
jgi:nicotinamide-nucleotide amidase